MTDAERAQPLIDLPEVARQLGVNERHVRRLVAERRIPFVKWGHLLRFEPAAIDVWLGDHRQAPLPPA
jgi:excisionase family DNA binding protein